MGNTTEARAHPEPVQAHLPGEGSGRTKLADAPADTIQQSPLALSAFLHLLDKKDTAEAYTPGTELWKSSPGMHPTAKTR